MERKYITEPEKKIEVVLETDVVVAGGGPFGFPAAIAAARNGMETVIIEHYSAVGGLMTTGLCNNLMGSVPQVDGGVYRELKNRLISAGSLIDGYNATFDPEAAVLTMNEMLEEAKVKPLLYTTAVDAVVEDSKVKGIIVESKSGRQAILAKVVIDATGDGDVAVRAGASYMAAEVQERQPSTLMFTMGGVDTDKLLSLAPKFGSKRGNLPDLRPNPCPIILNMDKDKIMELRGGSESQAEEAMDGYHGPMLIFIVDRMAYKTGVVTVNGPHLFGDACSNEDLTSMEILGRKHNMSVAHFLKSNMPGFEKSFLLHTAVTMGIRESRRITGDYVLTKEDILTSKRFEDTIANNWFPIQGRSRSEWYTNIQVPRPYGIPFRALLPKGLENIMVGGRDIFD